MRTGLDPDSNIDKCWHEDEDGNLHWVGPSGKQIAVLMAVVAVAFVVMEFVLPAFGITFS